MVFIVWVITFLVFLISLIKDKKRTIKALKQSVNSLKKLTPGVLGMVGVVGLMLAVISPEILKTVFTYKGFMGFVIVSSVGAIVTVPGPIAFPLAGSLLKLGASYGTIASFITTLTMVGVVTSPLEASYFGKKFTFFRQFLSFLAAIVIGLIMGAFV